MFGKQGGGVKHAAQGAGEDERFVPGGERFIISQDLGQMERLFGRKARRYL